MTAPIAIRHIDDPPSPALTTMSRVSRESSTPAPATHQVAASGSIYQAIGVWLAIIVFALFFFVVSTRV